ncbi:MAG TPA: FAD-dependent oxidoreductase [Nitrolancea sp.]|nr:FAD-dependent oxidoreductase [Nitrolancea sp.]
MATIHTDVLIIGGGVMGSSAAYFLKTLDSALEVTVIEPDPEYHDAATPKASGGVRRLFSCPENILMSQFSIAFYEQFAERMAVSGAAPDIGLDQQGYLFIASDRGRTALEANYDVQRRLGANVHLIEPVELASRFPSLHTDDLALAVLSPDDGWLDPTAVLHGITNKARSLGARYLIDKVVGLTREQSRVVSAELMSGGEIRANTFINTAGAWAYQLCELVGMPIPVRPMRRFEHYFECRQRIEPMPFIKDPQGLALRPNGRGYSGGVVDTREPRGFNNAIDERYFDDVVRPAFVHRIPAFREIESVQTWTGHYDQNSLDGNMIIGSWPDQVDNLLIAAGFSGHGLMHAPAVGRALAELALYHEFRSIDLTRMGYQRVVAQQPYREAGIV